MNRQKVMWARWLLGMVALSFWLGGCAAGTVGGPGQPSAPDRMEGLLVQAGFRQFPQSHPQCQALCQKLPAGRLMPYKKGDKTLYGYVTSDGKRLYAGDEAAYQRFINLAVMQQIEERHRPVSDPRDDPEFWTLWQTMHGGG